MSSTNDYQNRRVAFLTQHGKERLIKTPLETALGCQLIHTSGYDTDLLGTFTRDKIRPGSQLQAAKKKASISMSLIGASVGIASEGAFGMDPFSGFIPWNTELLVWIDHDLGIEVVGVAQGPAQSLHKTIRTLEELEAFAKTASFPEHHLVLRPENENHPDIIKGIDTPAALMNAFHTSKQKSTNGSVFIENDLRAHCNPTRQGVILKAADNLIQKLRSTCPNCSTPGYWIKAQKAGLPCAVCGRQTQLPISETWHCSACKYEEDKQLKIDRLAAPSHCDFCNP